MTRSAKFLLKHQSKIDEIENCPPSNCVNRRIVSVRFTHAPLDNNSFLTYYELGNDISRDPCKGHALSFFDSQENARKHYEKLRRSIPLIGKKIGDHLAEGILEKNDGLTTGISHTGHFSFFEYKGCKLCSKFKIVVKL